MAEPRKSRGWIWYFVILAILAAAAVTVMIVYNLQQQLKPEQLGAARELWAREGPADYDLDFTESGNVANSYRVEVRGGKVLAATCDGRPLEPRLYRYNDVPGLFDQVEGFLERDRQPHQPRTFTKAVFDARDGHLVRYIRRVMGTTQRLEINVRFRAVEKGVGLETGRRNG
jgi:hypothetical protein